MKKLYIILLGLLALSSCTTGTDEPLPLPEEKPNLYMATEGLTGCPETIYNLYGDTVYQCEDAESSICSLVAEGLDWYALIIRGDGAYNVVKNGKSIYLTGETIHCFTVENGSIYTVQENKVSNTTWVCKDFERIHEVVGAVLYNNFSVDHGNVTMAIYYEPEYWYNGEFIPIEGLEGRIEKVYGIDKKGDDMLITYQDNNTGADLYWWNGVTHEFPEGFIPTTSCIAKGHFFVLGRMMTTLGGHGSQWLPHGLPWLIMDGYEEVLSTKTIDFEAAQLVELDGTTYILVKSLRGATSYIFRGFQLLDLPTVEIPDKLKSYYSYYKDGKVNLSDMGIKCIAVGANQEQQ